MTYFKYYIYKNKQSNQKVVFYHSAKIYLTSIFDFGITHVATSVLNEFPFLYNYMYKINY